MTNNHVPARIGQLFFKYDDPDVSVDTEQQTVEHDTIDDNLVVQSLGRVPDQITVETHVATYETDIIDDLTKQGIVSLRTTEWKGDVIVRSTTRDPELGIDADQESIYRTTIECIEVDETVPGNTVDRGGGATPQRPENIDLELDL